MRTSARRLGAFVAAATLTATGFSLVASPAQAVDDPRPADIGGTWLAGQLVNGLQQSSFGGADVGLSIDSAVALQAIGGHTTDVTTIRDAVGPKVVETGEFDFGYAESDEYAYPNGFDKPGVFAQKGFYASGLAKSLYFAQTSGVANIPAWAGADLVADLSARVITSGPSAGRVQDASSFGDFANVLSQAYAANALTTAAAPARIAVTEFLFSQQCTAGYFRLNFTADKNAADQSCDAGRAAGKSAPDPDVTSEVVRLLLPQADNAFVARRLGKAEAWLLDQQRADGSFVGGTSTAVPNANSTGLAGWTLMLLNDTEAATRAAGWIRQHQADEVTGCTNGLTTQTGAIGYDDAAVALGLSKGITTAKPTWVRATSQSLPVLRVLPTTTPALEVTGPAGYLHAARAASYRVTGAVPGEKLCLTGGAVPVRAAANTDGVATVAVPMVNLTANRVITVTDRSGSTDAVGAQVLAAKKLKVVLAKARVKRGGSVRVTVSGLAPKETVTLRSRGRVVVATASASGTFSTVLKPGRKLGTVKVLAYGKFADLRTGSATYKVVK